MDIMIHDLYQNPNPNVTRRSQRAILVRRKDEFLKTRSQSQPQRKSLLFNDVPSPLLYSPLLFPPFLWTHGHLRSHQCMNKRMKVSIYTRTKRTQTIFLPNKTNSRKCWYRQNNQQEAQAMLSFLSSSSSPSEWCKRQAP